MSVEFTPTPHGFKWGPAEVLRATEINGNVILWVKTKKRQMVIRVTPSGLIRLDEGEPA